MAFSNSPFESQHPPSDLDRKIFTTDLFDDTIESDTSLLDTGLLSPTSTERKNSFATTSTSIFSPQSTGTNWDEYPVSTSTTLPERHIAMGSHYSEQPISNNPFHSAQMFQWHKPTIAPGTYEPYAENYDGPSLNPFPAATNFDSMPVTTHLNNVRPASIMQSSAGAPSSITSPSPMTLAEQEMEQRQKRMRPNSPQRSMSEAYRRGDGVRKKNARFEIPQERNLANIDDLINAAKDDEELLKELKQQKRLLRNRQAALDSRQRKKKHTEELETEKKSWGERNQQLEVQMKELQIQFDALLREHQTVQSINQNLGHQVQTLQNEKEEMITKHTLETGELRKKISVLKEELECSPGSGPGSSDYADFTSELEGLNMGADGDWTTWVTDFAEVEQSQSVQPKATGVETTLVVGQRRKDTLMSDVSDKQNVPGGFLLLFLLYGAFVATRATSSTPLPPMSDEYRQEAAAILNHVLDDDSGVQQSNMAMQLASATGIQQVSWPQPSNTQGIRPAFSSPANSGTLNTLTQQILTPSKQQEAEAAFSMTPAQYNSMTSADFNRRNFEANEGAGQTQKSRKSLADLVRANREQNQQTSTMAEVYTRSLMWDRIPTEVVQEFRRMIANSDNDSIKPEYED